MLLCPPHHTLPQRLNPDDLLGRHKYRKDKEERMKSVLEGEGASMWHRLILGHRLGVVARRCRLAQYLGEAQGGAAGECAEGGFVVLRLFPLSCCLCCLLMCTAWEEELLDFVLERGSLRLRCRCCLNGQRQVLHQQPHRRAQLAAYKAHPPAAACPWLSHA